MADQNPNADLIRELELAYTEIEDVGFQRFVEHIESERRGTLMGTEVANLYQKAFFIATRPEVDSGGNFDPSAWLYAKFIKGIQHYVDTRVVPVLSATMGQPDAVFMSEWARRWRNFRQFERGICTVFMYLDRFYTVTLEVSLRELCYEKFYTALWHKAADSDKPSFAERAAACVTQLVADERAGGAVDALLLRSVVDVFVGLGQERRATKATTEASLSLYANSLQATVERAAAAYYRVQAREWLGQCTGAEYLAKADDAITREEQRVATYLHRSGLNALSMAVYAEVIKAVANDLAESATGVNKILDDNDGEQMRRMFRLFNRDAHCQKLLATRMNTHVRDLGTAIVAQAATAEKEAADALEQRRALVEAHRKAVMAAAQAKTAPPAQPTLPPPPSTKEQLNASFVSSLISLHARYFSAINAACVGGDSAHAAAEFRLQLRLAFETFINTDDRVALALAAYAHETLRRASKVSTGDVEDTVANIVTLYGYIRDKDVFEEQYQRGLQRRLLGNDSRSEQDEKMAISMLKQQCTFQWARKLEVMFADVAKSKQLTDTFVAARVASGRGPLRTAGGDAVEAAFSVCTSGNWPLAATGSAGAGAGAGAGVPVEFESMLQDFTQAYVNANAGHKLVWRFEEGSAEVTVQFNKDDPASTKTLVVTSYMMMALQCFNESKIVRYSTILAQTRAPASEMQHHVLSLMGLKMIMAKGQGLTPDTELMLNPKFASPLARIVVELKKDNTAQEQSEDKKKIDIARSHSIDAAIVRIMKARKELSHVELVGEVTKQLKERFHADPALVKKRIEAMIGDGYLERDPENRAKYRYLA